jgi:uncharacterized protein YukE
MGSANNGQVRADFSVMEDATADLTAHTGTLEDYGNQIKAEAGKVVAQLAGGVGTEEYQACMDHVNGLTEEHLANLGLYRGGTERMHDDYLQGAHDAVQRLSRGGGLA